MSSKANETQKFVRPEPKVCRGCSLLETYNCEDTCPNQPIEKINAKVLTALFKHYNGGKVKTVTPDKELNEFTRLVIQSFVDKYCWHGDDNSRLDFQNTVMYALRAPDQEAPIIRKFWEQFQFKEME